MTKLIIRIYEYLTDRKRLLWLLLLASVVVMGLLIIHIHYDEDIMEFLPFNKTEKKSMAIYQNLSDADRMVALVGLSNGKEDADRVVEATDYFYNCLKKEKIDSKDITAQLDVETATSVSDFVYKNIPYFLTDADYQRMDSLLADKDYIANSLQQDKQMLMFPAGGLLSENISKDPLNLFTPVVEKLSARQSAANYELYDGYIFTPDMLHAMVLISSPYGSSETENNKNLIDKIDKAIGKVETKYKDVSVRLTGGPVIAVGNASQIKTDSAISITIAVVVILLILFLSFRSARNILLIAISIAWGWMFALGGLSLVHSHISMIVVGISSVIIGIAINYPLHLIAHLTHTPDMKVALKEIVMPLLIGNITTVGAFLTLVPLKSMALRDLGLFASFLLIGTILFVIVFLPHLVRQTKQVSHPWLDRISSAKIENKRWIVIVVAVLTVVFGFFSFGTKFDTNISNINYMSKEQKENMNYLAGLQKRNNDSKTVYIVSAGATMDEALNSHHDIQEKVNCLGNKSDSIVVTGVGQFLCSKKEQQHRLSLWKSFIYRHANTLYGNLSDIAKAEGFAEESFNDFHSILQAQYKVRSAEYFRPLTSTVFKNNVFTDAQDNTVNIVDAVKIPSRDLESLSAEISKSIDDESHYHFEIGQLNSVIASSLSDNFNYIGYACGLIVFFFLWFSMGSIELAGLSFLPMAVSWLWILGIMTLTGTSFNIVNIILATFIFGQGDDYTIFITEGCQYEYAYGKKMLTSYKNSILISAVIMFIGMGSLIIARHPALHSLAVVTIIGMFSVVLMAWLLPPFVFRWITTKNGELRRRPLTLKSLLMPKRYPQILNSDSTDREICSFVKDAYYYCGNDIYKAVRSAMKDVSDDHQLAVRSGNYGSIALFLAMRHPDETVVAKVSNDDEYAVCKHIACRLAENIKIEYDNKENI